MAVQHGTVAVKRLLALHFLMAMASLGIVSLWLVHFHDHFWWPPDEGVYAYVAQRLLAGDRIHVDLVDLHGGYGNLINALAFVLFGEDLLSLRYPLVAATLAQCAFVYLLLVPRGPLTAAAGVLGVGAFSFIQFLNPSASWYALFLFFLMALLLDRSDPYQAKTALLAGLLLGLCFLVRQLSGVILAIGTLSWLLLRLRSPEPASRGVPILLAAIMAAGLSYYFWGKGSFFTLVWFGVWPLGIVLTIALRSRIAVLDGARLIALLSTGFFIGVLPLALQNWWNGALLDWSRDIVVTALAVHQQGFITQQNFLAILLLATSNIFASTSTLIVLNGIFWIITLMLIPVIGAVVLVSAWKDHEAASSLGVLAVFWGLIAVHYQIPIYLFFALPAAIAALLWLRPNRATVFGITALALWAVVFHAAQPLSRGLPGIVAGTRVPLGAEDGLPRASLQMEMADQQTFTDLLERINSAARPGEMLMTLPMDPELNFLTNRPAPVRYYGTSLGLRTQSDVAESFASLEAKAPLFIVHRRDDKYLTALSAELLGRIRLFSPPPERFGPFDLYRLPSPGTPREVPPERQIEGGF